MLSSVFPFLFVDKPIIDGFLAAVNMEFPGIGGCGCLQFWILEARKNKI
jgi:hypothetical protein